MNADTQAVLFNAVPLLVLAALYLVTAGAVVRASPLSRPGAEALLFGSLGLAAAIVGLTVLAEREPLAGHALLSAPAILLAGVPLLTARRPARSDAAVLPPPLSQRQFDAAEPADVARLLLDDLAERFELDLANLALIEDEGQTAVVVAARDGGRDHAELRGQRIALDREPSGINAAAREGAAFTVFDAERSAVVNRRLNAIARVKSCVFVPVLVGEEVIGVVFGAVRQPRVFDEAELASMQSIVNEAGVPLERARVAEETSRLLSERERSLAGHQVLLRAGEALTSDLHFGTVIERLVEELRALVNGDAADCWTLLPGGAELVCRAVLGLPEEQVGRTTPVAGTAGEAIASGAGVLRRRDGEGEHPTPDGFAEMMAAPISSLGETRGVLGVYSREPGCFEESDLQLIEAFASLASIALRNAEAYEESTRQTKVDRGFARIAAVLSEPLSERETLDAVAQAAAEALDGDSAAVLSPAGPSLELAGRYELAAELTAHLEEGAPALAACARAGKILASRRLAEDERFGEELGAAAAAADRRSLLAVPLQQPGGGTGLVLIFFRGERAFTDDQLELAGQVAAAACGALERSDLFERERRARQLAQRLAQAGRELAGELDPDNVLDQSVRHAVELLAGDGASVRMLERDEVVVRAVTGRGDADALATRAPSTAWLVGDIVQTRATRAIDDIAGDPRVGEADVMLAAGYAAYLGVPMIGPDDAVHGILAVYGRRPRAWRDEEAQALHALAATAAAARANAELYQGVSHEQQRSQAILANVADGIVAVDRDGRVVLWNPAAERVTGVSQAEALGKTPTEALGRPLEAASGAPGGSRLLPIRRGGEEVWLSLSEAVMTDPAGAVAGRIYAFRDISAERSVEQMKSDFVSTVSHELRTPLTSIYGFAETLLRQDVLFGEEERATFLRYIASESERLTAIVDRLLSVAQLDTGAMAVQLAETDVGAVVSEAVRTAEGADGLNGHRFVVELADEPLAAEADGEKLGQVLAHLLDNAVRYSPAGGTVTISARRSEEAVEVSVEDEGVGIPHAEQERIFRKFYRGDAAASGAIGAGATGLGLFLAEGLVTAMGGRIRVDSSEGQGSTFVLELRPAETGR